MDYPKKTPNVGLVGGKFADENASTGQPGSLIPSAWGNAVTDELLAVITAAGLDPSEDETTQLLEAIQAISASDMKRSVRCATTGAIALSGLQTIDGVALADGDRVLVKDQASPAQNWIYVASAAAWVRALDASQSEQCTPGHMIVVQAGTLGRGTVWQLSNDTLPQLGTTALIFTQALGRTGVAAGSYTKVQVGADGRVLAGSNPNTLAGSGIVDAYTKTEMAQQLSDVILAIRGGVSGSLDQLSKVAAALNNDPQFAANILIALAGKAGKGTTLADYGITDAVPIRNPLPNGIDVYGGDLAFLTANAEASIALNCYYTGQQWLRRDTSKSAICLGVSRSQGLFVARADAGTGPIAWTTSGLLDTSLAFTKAEIAALLADRLKQGDFGLGGYAPVFPGNDLNTQYDGTSWFRTTTGCLNVPPGANPQGSQVRHEVWGLGVVQQTFREHLTSREWHRASDSYVFGPWIEVVTNMVGAVQAFASTVPPTGWLVADGSQVLRANYPALLTATNGAFGWGNGSTTFNLPDMRGEVIRGLDLGRGINPGRALGSIELDAMQGHGHANTNQINGMSGGSGEFLSHNNGVSGSTSTARILGPVDLAGYGAVRVASETRMRNVAMLWCIKY
ncbi:tail fiber protein [Pseudomonas putida]|uniref:tail fiber protein n=1 Tax=Pseudomonas putida TaxID=303 RepID=UPI00236319B7|nr:tail fiber protein [Pseudomonas putida]MDD2150732.1 tail fiber protein [Pseudomonas putida]